MSTEHDNKATEGTEQEPKSTTQVTDSTSKDNSGGEAHEQKLNLVNLDNLTTADLDKMYADKPIFKNYIDAVKDKHFSKSLTTWKKNNLAAEVEKQIAERYPTETEEQKEMRALRQEIAQMKSTSALEKANVKALQILGDKQLPLEFAKFVVSEDEGTMLEAIENLTTIYNASIQSAVDARFKEHARTPQSSGTAKQSAHTIAKKSGNVKDMIKAKMNG